MLTAALVACGSGAEIPQNVNYGSARAPLQPQAFVELPLGSISPSGWLREMLTSQRDGATGHLDELYPLVMGPRNGWLGDYNDPISFLDMWITGGGNNDAQWSNAEFDSLIKQIKSSGDAEARMEMMHQAEDIIFDEWMLCPIYYYVDIYMAQQNLENLSTSPLGFKFFMNASNGTDTLKVCTGPDPDTIDPALNSAVDGGTMIDHAFEGLYTVAYGTTPTPGQAESVEISEDGLTYTFHLREGLKWSDGTPLTAHDFVYSWQRAVDPATGADYAYMFECIAGYTEAINGEEYVAPAADASSASTSESAAESVSASTSESASTSAAA